jgi:hypothetical protein
VKVIVIVTVIIGVIFIGICIYLLWRCMAKQKGNVHLPLCSKKDPPHPLYFLLFFLYTFLLALWTKIYKHREEEEMVLLNMGEDNHRHNVNQAKLEELPIFNLQELASATNGFHQSNKLGQGGFGPVYRVMVYLVEGYCLTI